MKEITATVNEDRTFWECVYDARHNGLIPRVWRTSELIEVLTPPAGRFSPNTASVLPYNGSVSREGNGIGDFVRRGGEPKAWRVGRGKFQLVMDPDDNVDQQHTQRELAMKRAGELTSGIRRSAAQQNRVSAPPPSVQAQRRSRTNIESNTLPANGRNLRASGRHESVSVSLNDLDLREIAESSTEQKALYIVEKYIRDEYGEQVEIEDDQDGADLRITVGGKTVKRIEVKGTGSKEIAWSQLKVSSQRSHDSLESGDASMYRVVDVEGTQPRIYMLTYGRDFTLEPEPRWAVKQVRPEDDRYPLRGRPYRYDHPEGPVAGDDWESLK